MDAKSKDDNVAGVITATVLLAIVVSFLMFVGFVKNVPTAAIQFTPVGTSVTFSVDTQGVIKIKSGFKYVTPLGVLEIVNNESISAPKGKKLIVVENQRTRERTIYEVDKTTDILFEEELTLRAFKAEVNDVITIIVADTKGLPAPPTPLDEPIPDQPIPRAPEPTIVKPRKPTIAKSDPSSKHVDSSKPAIEAPPPTAIFTPPSSKAEVFPPPQKEPVPNPAANAESRPTGKNEPIELQKRGFPYSSHVPMPLNQFVQTFVFRPGNHHVHVTHPLTGRDQILNLSLPAGLIEVSTSNNELHFKYPNVTMKVIFLRRGGVRIQNVY